MRESILDNSIVQRFRKRASSVFRVGKLGGRGERQGSRRHCSAAAHPRHSHLQDCPRPRERTRALLRSTPILRHSHSRPLSRHSRESGNPSGFLALFVQISRTGRPQGLLARSGFPPPLPRRHASAGMRGGECHNPHEFPRRQHVLHVVTSVDASEGQERAMGFHPPFVLSVAKRSRRTHSPSGRGSR